jgi:hypothetical protein
VDKSEIALIETGVKELTLVDKPATPALVSNAPPQNVNTPAVYAPLTPSLTPSSTPPMSQGETKQFRKMASPAPRVEINKSPDNNGVKLNSTGNSSPHSITTPPVEPFNGTPQQV